MNIIEMYELVKNIYSSNIQSEENNWDGYEYLGLRFEDKEREIGDTCECSRHNPEREDERDFPEFGTKEYKKMEILDGTSAWDMSDRGIYKVETWQNKTNDCRQHFFTDHCYIIAGNNTRTHSDADAGEIVIQDAIVIAQIF